MQFVIIIIITIIIVIVIVITTIIIAIIIIYIIITIIIIILAIIAINIAMVGFWPTERSSPICYSTVAGPTFASFFRASSSSPPSS